MRPVWYHTLIPGCALLALPSCGPGGDCGSGMFCPPPVTGYAQVNGRALRSDGAPIVGKQAYVGCGDPVGAYNDATDAAGNFEVRLYWAVADTLLYPYPPRRLDGSFPVSCQANLTLGSNNVLTQNPLVVRFAPAHAEVVPTVAELREAAP